MPGIAVVTGSSGFIGTRLVQQLVAAGYRVRRLLRSEMRPPASPFVESYATDFADADALDRSPALDGADVVFHLAGATRALDLDSFRAANVQPTANLLNAITRRRGARPRFILVSSQAAAGPASSLDRPVRECDAARPIEAYGRSKLEAEDVALRWARELPVTIVRPCSVYGPGDIDFLSLFRMVSHGLALYPGTRDRYLSLLHVDDVVYGLVHAAEASAASGEIYFFSGRQALRWRDVTAAIASAAQRRVREYNVPAAVVSALVPFGEMYSHLSGRVGLLSRHKVALSRPRYWICAADKAVAQLGFEQATDLPAGAASTYSWYVRAGWVGRS